MGGGGDGGLWAWWVWQNEGHGCASQTVDICAHAHPRPIYHPAPLHLCTTGKCPRPSTERLFTAPRTCTRPLPACVSTAAGTASALRKTQVVTAERSWLAIRAWRYPKWAPRNACTTRGQRAVGAGGEPCLGDWISPVCVTSSCRGHQGGLRLPPLPSCRPLSGMPHLEHQAARQQRSTGVAECRRRHVNPPAQRVHRFAASWHREVAQQ